MKSVPRSIADVRMHGFRQRSEVSAVLDWIDRHAVQRGTESIPLEEACGRTLAAEVIAPLDVPGFDRAAMDGFALRGSETAGTSEYNPLEFRVLGQAMPGLPFVGSLPPRSAVRIMTGAPVPDGVDSVVPAEFATEADGQIVVTRPVAPGQHVGHRGEDLKAGSTALGIGRRLRPQDLGLVASLGLDRVTVVRQPRVRVLVTGYEVKAPGAPKGVYDVYDSNSYMLRGLIARDGGVLEAHLRLGDDPDRIRAALLAPGADVILVSGGSSVGREDYAPRLIDEIGELAIHGVAMRPSSPAGLGRIGDVLVFLLPGNPVSCLCAYDFFAGRALRRLGGRPSDWPHRAMQAVVARKIVSAIGRVDYCRVRLVDGRVEPIALSGASILSSTTRADGFVIVPAPCEGYGPGADVTVYLYD
ncbi:MAG TPA: molybdopterin molybdotransferase MoeA [Burkholderiaceae bacterium]|nr:molybdopterin molybdotransferase MoeA [Burkholderiaceae bacterium]HQR69637.1 molybdopterin molybdotransferase MoeA [Burkholderiaceae bacterium]